MFLKLGRYKPTHNPTSQRGGMIVISLFVIVVLGLLGLTVTRLLSSSSETIIFEVLGQRAINAARAGIECKIAIKFPITAPSNPYCSEADNKAFNNVPGLENCSYVTTVQETTITDGLKTFLISKFSSTGQCSGGTVIVNRTLYADINEQLVPN
jgi:MSHA biogenesis protein MshP